MLFSLLFSFIATANGMTIKSGDVLLQSVPCYLCTMIEAEEKAPYSHAGVADVDASGNVNVLEAWAQIEKIPLAAFIAKRKANTTTLILQPIDSQGNAISIDETSLNLAFQEYFLGHDYDEDFLWNNTDQNGEKYYCSEFVAKLLNYFLPVAIQPKPMHFKTYRSLWVKYFNGHPPDGEPGLSPADFSRSKLFKKIGTI